jgi:hypothetical protein
VFSDPSPLCGFSLGNQVLQHGGHNAVARCTWVRPLGNLIESDLSETPKREYADCIVGISVMYQTPPLDAGNSE